MIPEKDPEQENTYYVNNNVSDKERKNGNKYFNYIINMIKF